MKITNKHGLPDSLVRAVVNDPYRYTGYISVTQLIQPPRLRWLTRRHDDELEEDVVDRLWTLMGSAVHSVLERSTDKHATDIQEERLLKDFDGVGVSGQGDVWDAPHNLSDYKFTSVYATRGGAKIEWEWQLNMLAHLYRDAGFPVEQAEIVAIYRDFSKTKAKQNKDYPKVGAQRVKINLWPDDEVESFIKERIKIHLESENLPDDELPFCTDEEIWKRADVWAVMKNKNKRATRLHASKEDAYTHAGELQELSEGKDKYSVIHRRGQCIRCMDYCPVKDHCNQYLQMIGHDNEDD